MTKARGKQQNSRGIVDKTIRPEPRQEFRLPPAAECTRREFDFPCPDRLVKVRLDEDSQGRIAGFAVILLMGLPGNRIEVARIDTAHNDVHLDLVDPDGTVVRKVSLLKTLESHADVKQGYDRACAILAGDEHHPALMGHLRRLEWA